MDEKTNGTETSGSQCPNNPDVNGHEEPSGTAYLIGTDASENDTDSDSEDEIFVPARATK